MAPPSPRRIHARSLRTDSRAQRVAASSRRAVRLKLYASRRGDPVPNLIAIQSEELDMLPTVLVCPFQVGYPVTRLRVQVERAGKKFVVLCELARPIHRRVLVQAGEVNEGDSRRVMETFRLLLAR